ncbi:hypothetical protein BCR35DRAFT_308959 [Leucosporidium creatinivorum]|uniref:Magnesium transporter NIPA-domain-containing protein n=1 Tax=Leucosporidium creatinivorum TaxID=106004 RepID=A0A1Y2DTV0_9BASI|nr:hypothetical protein BCR35DRAFT_308959 [Leucosporidium creatinivorum]
MQNETDLYADYKSYTAVDFIIGLFIVLGASLANALGLNVTKLDFTRQEALPPASRRPDWQRPYWYLGLILYVASQVIGSTLALEFLRAEYVAPLGSTSLIFNVVFAYLLAGIPVTRTDVYGTLTIVLGVVGVVAFGNHRAQTDFDKESNLSLSLLKEIWARKEWVAYYSALQVTTASFFWLSTIVHQVCMARITDERGDAEREADIEGMLDGGGGRRGSIEGAGFVAKARRWKAGFDKSHGQLRRRVRRMVEKYSQSRPDSTIRKLAGLCWSVTGGLLAGQTLILAKSGVKLVTSAINKTDPNEANQFTSVLPWIIIILLVVAAVTQVYCLNASLKCYDSTFTVPIFFATYTTSGFCNSLAYLDEFHTYQVWVFICIWLSIAVLVAGVVMLSMKKPPARPRASSTSRAEAGQLGDDGLEMGKLDTPSSEHPPSLPLGLGEDKAIEGPRQGFFSKWFGGLPADAPLAAGGSGSGASGEESRKHRRKGAQRLDDGPDDADSVLDAPSVRGGAAIELDEVDGLEFGEGSERKERNPFGDEARVGGGPAGEDEFGEFEEAHETREGRRIA